MDAIAQLVGQQNVDGGWPYRTGTSWTEPTVYALLAHLATRLEAQSLERGLAWLRRQQRRDGGWAPAPSVAQSTWVTALVALLPAERIGRVEHVAAIDWLLRESGEESSWVYRLRRRLSGNPLSEGPVGWPWFPGTAAWVTPTAMAVLALEKAQGAGGDGRIVQRIAQGREFLLSRRCADGGWNHGANRALRCDGESYPETTGIALLALHGSDGVDLEPSWSLVRKYLVAGAAIEAVSWLQLALAAHRKTSEWPSRSPACRDLRETALWILAQAAAGGANVFLPGT
jgi:hypothetical protein